jgi:hypothetical protein
MTLDARMGEYLEVVAALKRLVAEEVYFIIILLGNIIQAKGLIPACPTCTHT